MKPPTDAAIVPLEESECSALRALAETIWRHHYVGIVSAEQVEYMLACRFSDDALQSWVGASDRWLELLRVDGALVGYCSYELADDGAVDVPATMKLGQLYVLESHRGRGLGRLMLDHMTARARGLGRTVLRLQVNKRNAAAIRFYELAGFGIAREAVFDIGSGFVMDDYVMEKTL